MLRDYPVPTEDSALLRSPAEIIDLTNRYRTGYDGIVPPWFDTWVYIGDHDDACPVVLDTVSGKVTKTDHGNLGVDELDAWDNIEAYLADHFEVFDVDPDL